MFQECLALAFKLPIFSQDHLLWSGAVSAIPEVERPQVHNKII